MITTVLRWRDTGARSLALAVVVVLLLLGARPAEAQEILIGGRIEPTVGWISGSDWEDAIDYWDDNFSGEPHKPRFSFSGGAVFAFGLAPGFALQAEVLISHLGGNYSYDYTGITVEGNQRATLLQIPLFLKPRIATAAGDFYFLLGPTVGIFLSDLTYEESAMGLTVEDEIEPDNSVIAGLAVAAGHEWELGPGAFGAEVRYTRQLTDATEDFNARQNAVGLGLSYLQRVK
jgi:hypothetical protein